MSDFTALDVKALREATGAGMMDCKRALTEASGDSEAAAQWLREKGIAKVAARAERDSNQGTVALASNSRTAAIVELRCETDFSAKATDFVTLANELAELVLQEGPQVMDSRADAIQELSLAKKENIHLGKVARVQAGEGNLLDTYLHTQDGRGTTAVVVEAKGISAELAHEVALHIAFAKPAVLHRDQVAPEDVERERESLVELTKAEGKPEQAWDKIVTGRLRAWYSERVLLEQGMFGEKETVQSKLGDGEIVRYELAAIGS
ncbi:MAG: translation elongation factor Ts [bacterium]|nr:translation elongation factor Ts [bacterium]MCY4164070.1 translation elongation factor Ts [bacterium]MCY4256992.1 translation elongation factor Ts [bacterium]